MDIQIDCSSIYYGLKQLKNIEQDFNDFSQKIKSITLPSEVTKKSLLTDAQNTISKLVNGDIATLIEQFEETKSILIANDSKAALLFDFCEQGIIDENGNFTDVPLLTQDDYAHLKYSQGTVATSGCGITSLCMVASYILGKLYTPDDLAEIANADKSSNVGKMTTAADYVGLNWVNDRSTSREDLVNYLKEGKLVICLVKNSTHFLVCTGVTEDGKIIANDPYRSFRSSNYDDGYSWDELQFSAGNTWIFDPAATTGAQTSAGTVSVSSSILEQLGDIDIDGVYNETVQPDQKADNLSAGQETTSKEDNTNTDKTSNETSDKTESPSSGNSSSTTTGSSSSSNSGSTTTGSSSSSNSSSTTTGSSSSSNSGSTTTGSSSSSNSGNTTTGNSSSSNSSSTTTGSSSSSNSSGTTTGSSSSSNSSGTTTGSSSSSNSSGTTTGSSSSSNSSSTTTGSSSSSNSGSTTTGSSSSSNSSGTTTGSSSSSNSSGTTTGSSSSSNSSSTTTGSSSSSNSGSTTTGSSSSSNSSGTTTGSSSSSNSSGTTTGSSSSSNSGSTTTGSSSSSNSGSTTTGSSSSSNSGSTTTGSSSSSNSSSTTTGSTSSSSYGNTLTGNSSDQTPSTGPTYTEPSLSSPNQDLIKDVTIADVTNNTISSSKDNVNYITPENVQNNNSIGSGNNSNVITNNNNIINNSTNDSVPEIPNTRVDGYNLNSNTAQTVTPARIDFTSNTTSSNRISYMSPELLGVSAAALSALAATTAITKKEDKEEKSTN